MANSVYPLYLQGLLAAGSNYSSDNIKAMLVTSAYSYSTAHAHVSDVTGIIVRGATALASKTETNGVADAADFTFTAVASGSTVAGIIVYDDSPATDATKPLICFIDHDASANPISLPTNGGDITIQWNASGIFSI